TTSRLLALSGIQTFVLATNNLLVDLAHRAGRNFINHHELLGQLPLGEVLQEVFIYFLPGNLFTIAQDQQHEGSLIPFRVFQPDNRGLVDLRVGDHRIFHVDRRNPFATGFDDVFEPVGDFNESVLIDRGHVTGTPIAVHESIGHVFIGHAVIACGDPGTFDQHLTFGLAVGWHLITNAIDDFHLHVYWNAPLFGTVGFNFLFSY